MNQLLQFALGFLRNILPNPSLKAFKLNCFRALLGALVVDIGISLYVNWPNINFLLSGSEVSIVIIMVVLLVFLVIVDAIMDDRRRRFASSLRDILTDPNVPENVKEIIARELLGN